MSPPALDWTPPVPDSTLDSNGASYNASNDQGERPSHPLANRQLPTPSSTAFSAQLPSRHFNAALYRPGHSPLPLSSRHVGQNPRDLRWGRAYAFLRAPPQPSYLFTSQNIGAGVVLFVCRDAVVCGDVGGCGEGGEEMLFKIKIEKNNTTSKITARYTNNSC